jgi:Ni/Co efflux regulator RcnB
MKKILTVLTLSLSAMFISNIATAAPYSADNQNNESRERGKGFDKRAQFDSQSDEESHERRKNREERGVNRLRQHKWQTGYIMPQHYRGNSYKTEYKDNNLPKPGKNQQWYKVNNDYILVDSDNNNIVKIQQN